MTDGAYICVILPLRLSWEPCYRVPDGMTAKDGRPPRTGDRVKVRFAGKEYIGVVSATGISPTTDPSRILPVEELEEGLERISPQEITFWRNIAGYYLCSIGEVYKAAYPSTKTTVEMKKRRKSSAKAGNEDGEKPESELSCAQSAAYDSISETFSKGKVALLKGVTGSGKTEIYIKLALETLEKGRNVLYLVPEIALGRQLEERLAGIFGDRLRTCHSAMTTAGRRDTATFVREGQYVVLGTRSSLFLPHNKLGLIIIDEEQDTSYKQESPAPRYNGRDAAVMLAAIHQANVVMGSATPSMESLYNCSTGKYDLVTLDERYYAAGDSDVEIIDTIAERKKNGMVGNFSRKLVSHIEKCLSEGGQAMILRARRAWSAVVQCPDCGHIARCPHCNVSMSLHKDKSGNEFLSCHYCGHREPFNPACPDCGGTMVPLGSGTQKIEDEAGELFPGARIARLDSDSAKSGNFAKQTIKDFSEGKIDILVGTQIVAKGFDFSGLTLVAVLQADNLLGLEDFRADERAAQLLSQFRGRCGRRDRKGLFVIQTTQPDHPVYRSFAESSSPLDGTLLEERKAFGYPPFTRIVNVILKDSNQARLSRLSREVADRISAIMGAANTTGPFAPPVDRISDQHILHIRASLAKDRNSARKKQALASFVEQFMKDRKWTGHIFLDVDPI